MKTLLRRLSSVRVRLTLWNTLTFALVLIFLGIAFRFLSERYLLNALDRELAMQGKRFQRSQHIEMLVFGDNPPQGDVTIRAFSTANTLKIASYQTKKQYRFVQKIGEPLLDMSGQFLYRSFNLEGKPLSSALSPLPFQVPLPHEAEWKLAETYRPWDQEAFAEAAHGREYLSIAEAAGASLRLLSVPLKEEGKIIGVLQIAAPLSPVYRDIAGLTRSLLLILPLALFVAAAAGVFLTERALRPVQSLTHAAAGIHPDQLSQRLPVSGADEFDELASTFNRALDRVELAFLEREKAMEQLRRFTADASHELRTPLTTIKTNTGVALTETEPSPEHVHALRQIDRAADRMTALVRDLLLLARSDAGQVTLDRRLLLLEEVLREAIEILPASSHAAILLDVRAPELRVCGDTDHLCRLFLNLLENAARYTPSDGQIQVTLERQEHQAVVRIQDTGCGIAAEHLPHLGERFYRADAGRNRRQGGAGLGLAICRSIVAQHQGSFAIASEQCQGTTVTICLPLSITAPGPQD